MSPKGYTLRRATQDLMLVGPGLFCVGYTVGTGAITKLTVAGTVPDLKHLGALVASCLLFWAVAESCGRYAAVTGGTALYGIRYYLPGGQWLALLILTGVVIGQWTGLPVLSATVAKLAYGGLQLLIPSMPGESQGAIIGIAAGMLCSVFLLLLTGRYVLLERTLAFLVVLMVGGFVGAMWLARPSIETLFRSPILATSTLNSNAVSVVALLGLALAAPTFLVRTLLVKGKGWTIENTIEQRRDAIVSAAVILIIGVSVMACVAGALQSQWSPALTLWESIQGLRQTSGNLAAGLFLVGIIAAGLSSMIPMAMVLPLLLDDYGRGEVQIRTHRFRLLAALACIVGLTGVIFEDLLLPMHRIGSQLAQLFVLPLTVGGVLVLVNQRELMGRHRAGFWLNSGLLVAFGFALVTAGLSLIGLWRRFT